MGRVVTGSGDTDSHSDDRKEEILMYNAIRHRVFNRGVPPESFVKSLCEWSHTAPAVIFAPNDHYDIYNKVSPELGPWLSIEHRRAVMLETLCVLAGFEAGWDWTEGVDTSRLGADTPANSEAGVWQVSWGSRHFAPDLEELLWNNNITDGVTFQRKMKFEHSIAMEYSARLLRAKDGWKENGPLYKGDERAIIRKSLRAAEQSVYPWLSRAAVAEFMQC